MEILSILFEKDKFTTKECRAFLKRNRLKPIKKVEIKNDVYEYILKNPHASHTITKTHIKSGIDILVGKFSDNNIYES